MAICCQEVCQQNTTQQHQQEKRITRSLYNLRLVAAGGRVIASPYAKKLAREAGVDISQASATGPDGRIVAADVQKLVSEGGGKGKPQQASAPGPEQSGQVCNFLCVPELFCFIIRKQLTHSLTHSLTF